jgi:hypothetical protein
VAVIVECFIAGILVIHLLLSAAAQISQGRLVRPLRRRDILGLIPTWTFFAPSPGRNDYHLLIRDETVTGSFSPWREVTADETSPVRALWNPGKRLRKGLSDHISSLLRSLPEQGGDASYIVFHPSYLALLWWISHMPRDPFAVKRQFAVAMTSGFASQRTEPAPLFVSYLHALDPMTDGESTTDTSPKLVEV